MNTLFGIMMGFILNKSIENKNYYVAICTVIAFVIHIVIVYFQ
jgi:F0F1-type ATP synthase assembly protein I